MCLLAHVFLLCSPTPQLSNGAQLSTSPRRSSFGGGRFAPEVTQPRHLPPIATMRGAPPPVDLSSQA